MSHLYKQKAVFWLAYSIDGKLHRISLKTKDKATARYLQAKKDQDLSEHRYQVIDAPVGAALDEFDKASCHHKTKRTHREDLSRIRAFLAWAGIGKVSGITEKALEDYFSHKMSQGSKPGTVNRIMASLRTFLNFAVRRNLLRNNPVACIKKYRPPVNPPRFLTKDEIAKVMKAAKRTSLYPAVSCAIYTGMRRGELFSLEWTDVDLGKREITVSNKEGFTTKSRRFRVIPIHPTLCGILAKYRKPAGRCFDQVNQRRIFARIMRQAKLGDDVGWHSLRHTFASQLVMAGVDIVTVSKLLGHSAIATTMIYSHLTRDHVRTAVSRLDF